jgi:hypothetical protein
VIALRVLLCYNKAVDQKPNLNQADINLLKQVFATKADLKKELTPIKRDIKQIKQDINSTLRYIDEQDSRLAKRITRLEAGQTSF